MSGYLLSRREGDVLHLSLNRPDLRNAMNEPMIEELTEAFRGAGQMQDIRFVLLSGEGKSFCAGADIDYMRRLANYSHDDNLDDARRLGELFGAVHGCIRPVICQVHGAAIGGGIGLVAASDFVVATEGTVFGFSEVRLGILPGVISPFILKRIGPAACRRLFLTGERFDSHRALALGLVDHSCPPEDVQAQVDSILKELRLGSPSAQTANKRMLDEITSLPLEQAMKITPGYIAGQRATDEAKEGFAAYFDKRKPSWISRDED